MANIKSKYSFEIYEEHDIDCKGYDAIVFVSLNDHEIRNEKLRKSTSEYLKLDPTLKSEIGIFPLTGFTTERLVYAPTGPLDVDYDDVRSLKETAVKGIQRALKAGVKRPLVTLEEHAKFPKSELVILLGILEGLYVPIQVRELAPENLPTIEKLGIYTSNKDKTSSLVQQALTLDRGLCVARDIGWGDPERMAPPKVQEYVQNIFSNSSIKFDVISDINVLTKEYPLFEAVNRAASVVERHCGRIIYLEYNPPDPSTVKETVFLVGKGVTYDTGGADVKAGGIMAGMSRDKCGAAAVAGFMQIVDLLKPDHVRVVAGMSMVRNSIGSNCYVADELIKARSGALVRIGNTDAEGRMVMADVLCRMKELALDAINPHLFTVATLTGHAFLTVGPGYSIVMDNGPAKCAGTSRRLYDAGEALGDPFEISTIRREDLQFHRGVARGDDVMQCNNNPSSRTPRGHQGNTTSAIP
ncbi:leucine aminopeptidase-related [Holotrichia oblita]|uniref:Leucine aminopeptidase-related n=1 Tax=Holotrichia oblita TaxID=644536 RepID=A0ACB9T4K4_HOLOL|nr:leucine aminopeptidase-related [Holotrichia oblita]